MASLYAYTCYTMYLTMLFSGSLELGYGISRGYVCDCSPNGNLRHCLSRNLPGHKHNRHVTVFPLLVECVHAISHGGRKYRRPVCRFLRPLSVCFPPDHLGMGPRSISEKTLQLPTKSHKFSLGIADVGVAMGRPYTN